MSFLLYLAAGFLSGLLGGMGMGGGTLLIPVLTVFLGVEQHVAQAANLIAFLPMALFSLKIHSRNGLINAQDVWWMIIPAALCAAAFGVAAAFLPADFLKKAFGAFLVFLAVRVAFQLLSGTGNKSF